MLSAVSLPCPVSRMRNGCAFAPVSMIDFKSSSLPLPRLCARSSPVIHMSAGKQKVFFVLGNAGTGKGTQCERLAEHFSLEHLSAGDLLRKEIKSGSERGAMIERVIGNGEIVPSEITIELLKQAIKNT